MNPISEEHTCLRVRLLPSLMSVLRKSKHRDLPQKVFEVGDIMTGMVRSKQIAGVSVHSRSSFTEIKSLVESLLRDLSVKGTLAPSSCGTFIDGRGADVLMDGKRIGTLGESIQR